MPGADHPGSAIESDRRWSAMLAGIGGFVDAAGFLLLLGLFTAHMSGNSTGFGVALATGQWGEALRRGFVIPVFVLATAAGVAWIESRPGSPGTAASRNRAIAGVLGVEVALLVVFLALALRDAGPISMAAHPAGFFLAATAATAAMGLQNAALRRVQTTAVHTTFVTGMLTELAVATVRWRIAARHGSPSDAARARVAAGIAASVWGTYAVGALGGAWLVARHGAPLLLVPIALLLAVMFSLLRTPATTPA